MTILFGKKKPEPPKQTPPPISDAKKAQAAKLMSQMNAQAGGAAQTKEDKIREIIEKDPEKAAQLLRDIFLNDKK